MGEHEASGFNTLHQLELICEDLTYDLVWDVMQVLILFLGLVANLPLAWLFYKERKNLSPSKGLGLNLLLMQLLQFVLSPVGPAIRWVYKVEGNGTLGNYTMGTGHKLARTAEEGVYILVMTGSPLLLAFMCVERYLAAARPVLYLRARKWEYKIAISAAVWAVTLMFVVVTALEGVQTVVVPIAVLMASLFLVMFSCLVGLAWSLWQQSPAHSSALPLKRRALWNVLIIIVPAVFSYLTIILLVPVVMHGQGDEIWCNFMEAIFFCPFLGTCIGPLFYLARFRQVLCRRKGGGGE